MFQETKQSCLYKSPVIGGEHWDNTTPKFSIFLMLVFDYNFSFLLILIFLSYLHGLIVFKTRHAIIANNSSYTRYLPKNVMIVLFTAHFCAVYFVNCQQLSVITAKQSLNIARKCCGESRLKRQINRVYTLSFHLFYRASLNITFCEVSSLYKDYYYY